MTFYKQAPGRVLRIVSAPILGVNPQYDLVDSAGVVQATSPSPHALSDYGFYNLRACEIRHDYDLRAQEDQHIYAGKVSLPS